MGFLSNSLLVAAHTLLTGAIGSFGLVLSHSLDADSDGHLVAGELKDVVSKYNGEAFDEKQFFEWFDVHGTGGKPDSQLDLKEFGWYLADKSKTPL